MPGSYDGGVTEEAGGSVPVAPDAAAPRAPAHDTAPAGPPALARWRWTITAAFGLGGITISAWGPRLPAIKTSLGIGTATIGLLLAGVTVGAIGGLLASTPVLHWLGSRRAVTGALLLIAAALAVMGAGLAAADGQPRPDRGTRLRHWLHGWLDWQLLLIGVVMLGVELGEGSAGNWLTLAVRNGHGQAAAVAALFATAFAVGEATTRIFGGPLVDRLGRVLTIRVTTALGVAGMLLFILAGNIWVVLAGVLLWSVGVSMGFPLGMSAAAESGPDPAARVSVVASIGYFANLAGPPAIGVLAQSAGLLNSLWLIVALFVAAFAAAGSFRPRPITPVPEEP